MNSRKVKQVKPATNKHLLLIAALLFAFGLGLAVGRLQSGAVVLLLIVLAVVIVALLGESFHLWQAVYRKQLRKPLPVKRSVK